jgi:type II secretory pathway component PulJ
MRARGTTLLETLVALAVTALVLAALAGLVSRAHAARTRATAAADRVAAVRTVLVRMAAELEAARAPGTEVTRDPTRLWSALRFTTTVRDPAPPGVLAGDVRLVGYRVEPDGALVRRETARPAPPDAVETDGTALLHGVRAFRVRCFDGTAWVDAWPAGPLPRAVQLDLAVDDGAGGVDEIGTAVALPLARESG